MTEKQTHGIWGVKMSDSPAKTQNIAVCDGGDGLVWLHRTSYEGAGLTPDEAEWFAEQIVASAKRVRIRANKNGVGLAGALP
jgi:hypothetical protein